MSAYVVDASVGVKWYVAEVYAADAQRLLAPGVGLHAPGFFDVELANVLWKKVRRGELTPAEADSILAAVAVAGVTRHPDAGLVPAAFGIAVDTGRSVYDCLYVALAARIAAKAATADQRLVNALRGTPWEPYVLWVEDVP